ncbi:type 1 glutamine amidotransferase domain-containing protein [Hoyosella sp. YIM 151337]|uniref:type 1 glutamine amidotransferase domain-containing protein n=1 Tax=Hoyosella sp. YIM 151337 TaxID=2992742 RepID=UPI0022363859|nr:type 1 glutamine amidotransferase domain-containing protein [Hoyosella sp. YIM 151337]MCW4354523.1 type 1 glutamine amidotransferase domain-containing protein [Hoyosella sp. YIM 151337]
MSTRKVLVIVTSVGEYQKFGFRTGLWLGELTHFWDIAESAGIDLEIASIAGGAVPIDPESLAHDFLADHGTGARYRDRQFMNLLHGTKSVAEVSARNFDAIYLTGGHGVMYDFPESWELATLIAEFYESGKVVASVCHGAAGLLNVVLSDGKHLIEGKTITGFSWPEEDLAQRADAVPFNLETELKKRGANYQIAAQPFEPFTVTDGTLITGQNPASSIPVAEAVVKALS